MSKETDKQLNLVRKQLDKIYTNSSDIAQSFKIDNIALNTLKIIIGKNKLPISGQLKEFNKQWNKTLDLLNTSCINYCKEANIKGMPLNVLKYYIGILKDNL